MERFLKATILTGLGIFLYTRLANETIFFYINRRFITLTLLASGGFILVGASYFRRPTAVHDHDHDDHPDAHHNHQHDAVSWVGLLIVMLPLILGWLVPPQPLGASAVSNREISVGSLSSVTPPRNNDRQGLIPGEKNILDWLADFQENPDPAAYAGQEVHVIGFVYRDERFPTGSFLVGRFIVSCCVADAAPVGLVARWPEAADLKDDQWIDVRGHFESGTFNGETLPVLIIDQLTVTEQPDQPYLYG